MKNTEKNLDDIIFEKRNKTYGAYALRKSYSRNLIRAMVISFTIFLMGVSIPLIGSYMDKGRTVIILTPFEPMDPPAKDDNTVDPPEAPKQKTEHIPVFAPPIVTSDTNQVIDDFDQLMSLTINRDPNDTGTIDIPDIDDNDDVIDDNTEEPPLPVVSEMPEFPNGDEGRIKFFSENLKYPQIAKEIGVQGKVFFTFVVEKDGSISNIKLLRGIGSGCDEEAARVVAMMPNWKPGRQNGKEVRVQFNMPISFVLR